MLPGLAQAPGLTGLLAFGLGLSAGRLPVECGEHTVVGMLVVSLLALARWRGAIIDDANAGCWLVGEACL
jgi:hypothetical protein